MIHHREQKLASKYECSKLSITEEQQKLNGEVLYVNAKARKCLGKWLFYAYCAKGSRVSSVGERETTAHRLSSIYLLLSYARIRSFFFIFFNLLPVLLLFSLHVLSLKIFQRRGCCQNIIISTQPKYIDHFSVFDQLLKTSYCAC